MITNSGVQMFPGNPGVPTPHDIAVGMCRITRYAGALWLPLAAHSILVAEYSARGEPYASVRRQFSDIYWAMGLLHDAHETVTGEVTRHYKPKEMKVFESELDEKIFKAFHLDVQHYRTDHAFFKTMDEKALTAECVIHEYKNWPAYYKKREGREIPRLTRTEIRVARQVFSFWLEPTMICDGSPQIERLAEALKLMANGKIDKARKLLSVAEGAVLV